MSPNKLFASCKQCQHKKIGLVGHFFNERQDRRFLWDTLLHRGPSSRSRFRRSIATITIAIVDVDHFTGTVVVRPGYAASYCVFCAGRLTQTVRCGVRTVKVPFSCKLGRRRHLYVVIFPPSVLRPSRTQCSYKLPTYHYDPLARAVRQRLRALLSCSQRSSPPMPPSSDPSSADTDADDHSSAPSPASSACEYSIPMVYPSEIPSDDVTLLPLANSELTTGAMDELAPLRDFHVRIFKLVRSQLSSISKSRPMCRVSSRAARSTDRPFPVPHRKKLYGWMWKDLLHCESHIADK
jgi:hypothetical protein